MANCSACAISRTATTSTDLSAYDDSGNRITLVDAGGLRRLKKDSSGVTKSFSSGAMYLCETLPSGPISYIQGHQLLGMVQGSTPHYLVTDGLSSVRVVVNASGTPVGGFGYNEFGLPDATSPPPVDLRGHSYTGGLGVRNDGVSLGLFYARQRYFDASLGRWLSQDPIGFDGGLNLYAGMGNNPVKYVDPDGLKKIRVGPWEFEVHLGDADLKSPRAHQSGASASRKLE